MTLDICSTKKLSWQQLVGLASGIWEGDDGVPVWHRWRWCCINDQLWAGTDRLADQVEQECPWATVFTDDIVIYMQQQVDGCVERLKHQPGVTCYYYSGLFVNDSQKSCWIVKKKPWLLETFWRLATSGSALSARSCNLCASGMLNQRDSKFTSY